MIHLTNPTIKEKLFNACLIKDLQKIKEYVFQGANVHTYSEYVMCVVCELGDLEYLKFLVENKNVNYKVNNWECLEWAKKGGEKNNHIIEYLNSLVV
jgi:hypothetical protein